MRMKYAESHVPSAATQIVARGTRFDRRSQPKIQSPRNVDSRKNAPRPSIASGAPKTLPTYFEYTDQFIPNWNSCTRPVATPIAKLISISVPKNFVSLSHASSPLRCHSVCMTATSGASPSVSGTNRKWYSDVVANWIRARSTAVEASGVISCRHGRLAHAEPLEQVVADAERVRHRGQGRVDGADAREEARVDDVQVVELVRLAVDVEHRLGRVNAEAARAGLMGAARDRDVVL